ISKLFTFLKSRIFNHSLHFDKLLIIFIYQPSYLSLIHLAIHDVSPKKTIKTTTARSPHATKKQTAKTIKTTMTSTPRRTTRAAVTPTIPTASTSTTEAESENRQFDPMLIENLNTITEMLSQFRVYEERFQQLDIFMQIGYHGLS